MQIGRLPSSRDIEAALAVIRAATEGKADDKVSVNVLASAIDLLPVAPKTREWYRGMWRRHVLPWWGDIIVEEITTAHEMRYRLHREKQGAAVSTRNSEVSTLSTLLKTAGSHGIVKRLPAWKPTGERGANVRHQHIDTHSFDRAWPYLSQWMRAFMLIVLDGGLRRNECRTLRWRNIDFDDGLIHLDATNTKGKWQRSAILSDRSARELMLWRDELEKHGRLADWVFPSRVPGQPISENTALTAWQRALERAGIKGADAPRRIHDGRRTWCTEARRAEVPLPDLLHLGGWKTDGVMRRHYSLFNRGDLVRAREKMEAARAAKATALERIRTEARKGPVMAPGPVKRRSRKRAS